MQIIWGILAFLTFCLNSLASIPHGIVITFVLSTPAAISLFIVTLEIAIKKSAEKNKLIFSNKKPASPPKKPDVFTHWPIKTSGYQKTTGIFLLLAITLAIKWSLKFPPSTISMSSCFPALIALIIKASLFGVSKALGVPELYEITGPTLSILKPNILSERLVFGCLVQITVI